MPLRTDAAGTKEGQVFTRLPAEGLLMVCQRANNAVCLRLMVQPKMTTAVPRATGSQREGVLINVLGWTNERAREAYNILAVRGEHKRDRKRLPNIIGKEVAFFNIYSKGARRQGTVYQHMLSIYLSVWAPKTNTRNTSTMYIQIYQRKTHPSRSIACHGGPLVYAYHALPFRNCSSWIASASHPYTQSSEHKSFKRFRVVEQGFSGGGLFSHFSRLMNAN